MRITKNNYFAQVAKLEMAALDPAIKEMHEFIKEGTENGKDWSIMEDQDIAETYELQFDLIEKAIKASSAKSTKPKTRSPRKNSTSKSVKKPRERKSKKTKNLVHAEAEQVHEFDEQYKFIRRYLGLHGKAKTRHQLALFIKAIQRAITQKRVRKSSTYSSEINEMQKQLIRWHGFMNERQLKKISLNQALADKFRNILGRQQEMLSVKLIKAYINLQGKLIEKKRAVTLHNRITRAMNNGDLDQEDVFYSRLKKVASKLQIFIENDRITTSTFEIEEAELNGLQSALNGLSDGLGCTPCRKKIQKRAMMTGKEIIQLRFDRLGFKGKYHDLIGDPSRGFSVMISAPPKYGKSFLAIDFAGYLVQNHGKTLFVASEEGIDATLQEKILSTRYLHNDHFVVAESIPTDLSDYDFVFIDSVNDLRLTPEDIKSLAHAYPKVSWVLIFQNRKDGGYKGSAEFRHLVDSVIEFPERGLAIQYGRFNQGGELRTFQP